MDQQTFNNFVNNAIELFNNTMNNADEFYNNNGAAIQTSIERYQHLRELYVAGDMQNFRNYFCWYYNMRFCSQRFKDAFFNKMIEFKDKGIVDPVAIAREFRPIDNRFNFSFCTKMANFINDDNYPIYDSNIDMAFGFRVNIPGFSLERDSTDIYNILRETYSRLSDSPAITDFRTRYGCPTIGTARILDFIFFNIGRNL